MNFYLQRKFNKGVEDVTKSMEETGIYLQDQFNLLVNQVTGSAVMGVKTPLPDVLSEQNIPAGLFPKNINRYVLTPVDEADAFKGSLLEVLIPKPMEVKFGDGTLVRFDQTVKCTMTKGALSDITGIKLKSTMWTVVTSISVDGDKLQFQSSTKKLKAPPVAAFKNTRDGSEVNKF